MDLFFSYFLDDESVRQPAFYMSLSRISEGAILDGSSIFLRRDGIWGPPNATVISRQIKGGFDQTCLLYEAEAREIIVELGGDMELGQDILWRDKKQAQPELEMTLIDGVVETKKRIRGARTRFVVEFREKRSWQWTSGGIS